VKILLTGATGFIGANFLRHALARGHEVAGLVSPGKPLPPDLPAGGKITWLQGRLDDAPWREIEEFGADVCLHAAWITTPGVYLESPENFQLLANSIQFLKRVREAGTSHLIGIGTCVEYKISDELLSEDKTPIEPTTIYARCKNELRLALEAEAKNTGSQVCWARVFYPYGPGEHPSRLCSSIVEKLSRDEKIVLKTPESTKDYIFIDNLASALVTVMEKKFVGAINLGTGIGVSVREIGHILSELLGKRGLISEANPPQADPFPRVVADASRLRGLGWKPDNTVRQGLEKLVKAI
jgi:nucleoside-diphosphate-sugar epimerase